MTGALVVTWGTRTQVFGESFTAGRIGTVTGDGWTVEDLGSTNGTSIGTEGEQVWGARLLRKGDRVRIGHTVLTVVPA